MLFYLSYEYLNSNKKYIAMRNHSIYNWLFLWFILFVILVRSKWFFISLSIDYHLNTVEHLFFAFVLCLSLSIYFQIFKLVTIPLKRMLVVFISFNLIGLMNEYFQNFYQGTTVSFLDKTDIKDIYVNLVGSLLYVILRVISQIKI
jgi:hypothetical protein